MATLVWRDVSYTVEVGGSLLRRKKPVAKHIVIKVSGCARAGEILAILGPSGSGKSSLLDILGARKNTGKITGTITLDGVPCVTTSSQSASSSSSRAYARSSAYILQDDSLYEHLTVRETLVFSAQLRLPDSVPHEEKLKRVADVMRQLGIERCADTKVGGPFVRGVSGGERKRVSIGIELLKDPQILLLDEPTSGLSSADARTVINILRMMAASGHTVLTTIHQPSAHLYTMFDRVLLLSYGRTAYFGPARKAVAHFEAIGFQSDLQMNAAEFLLDAVSTPLRGGQFESPPQSPAQSPAKPAKLPIVARDSAEGDEEDAPVVCVTLVSDGSQSEPAGDRELEAAAVELDARFQASPAGRDALSELESLAPRAIQPSTPGGHRRSRATRYVVSRLTQIRVLTRRDLLMWSRDPNLFWAVVIQGIVLGVLAASNSRGAGGVTTEMMKYQLLFLLAVMIIYSFFTCVDPLIRERNLLHREHAAGAYSVGAFFSAKTLSSFVQYSASNLIFGIICVYLGNLNTHSAAVGYLVVWLIVFSNTSAAVTEFCASISRDMGIAIVASNAIMGLAFMFGGFLVPRQQIPAYWLWIYYGSFFTYAFSGAMVNEFSRPTAPGEVPPLELFGLDGVPVIGDKWADLAVMCGFWGAFRLGTWAALRYFHKERR